MGVSEGFDAEECTEAFEELGREKVGWGRFRKGYLWGLGRRLEVRGDLRLGRLRCGSLDEPNTFRSCLKMRLGCQG